jgi:hypothetical protein
MIFPPNPGAAVYQVIENPHGVTFANQWRWSEEGYPPLSDKGGKIASNAVFRLTSDCVDDPTVGWKKSPFTTYGVTTNWFSRSQKNSPRQSGD